MVSTVYMYRYSQFQKQNTICSTKLANWHHTIHPVGFLDFAVLTNLSRTSVKFEEYTESMLSIEVYHSLQEPGKQAPIIYKRCAYKVHIF